jgi:predicted permease
MTPRLLLKRLLALARRRRHDQEFEHELAAHLELAERDASSSGLSPSEAARQARIRFGSIERIREEQRDSRSVAWIERIARDLSHAIRSLRRTPRFSLIAALTLALGIGATTAIFSVVYGVLLKPLPFHDPDRLVAVYHHAPGVHPEPKAPQTAASYFTYREQGRVFEDFGMSFWEPENVSVTRGGEPEQIVSLAITDGLLPVLGVRPELGRVFRPEDDVPNAPNRVILSYGYWQRAFGGARDVIGQSILIAAPNAEPYEIVGVLPASFRFRDTDAHVFLPLQLNRATANPGGFAFRGVARLRPGITIDQASADISRMIPLIIEQFPLPAGVTPQMWADLGLAPNLLPLSDDVIGEMRRPLWILMATVVIVLILAWGNVASLLVVRAEGRQREFAVRRAIGATRGSIAAGLLTENLVLGLAGGALGIVFAQACISLLRWLAPVALPRADEIGINGVVLAATLATSVVTSLLFGLIPVFRCRSANVTVLTEAGRSTSDAPWRHRTRNVLVVTQIALALLLLVVSGLMSRTFIAMREVHPGFVEPTLVQTFEIGLPRSVVPDRQQVAQTYQRIVERLAQIPGVESVGLAGSMVMGGASRLDRATAAGPVAVEDRPVSGLAPSRKLRPIGPGYFETMGNRLLAGRSFTWPDIHQRARVAIVSENFAREYWGEPAKALGRRVSPGAGRNDWSEIVGVAGNERDDGLNQPAPTILFSPMGLGVPAMKVFVRSDRVGSTGFLRDLQQAVWSINPNVPLATVRTLHEIQAESMSPTSFAMVMLGISAGVALLLSVVGIYGVVSYIVTRRHHEIGIRMALGAQSGDVLRLFLRHGLLLTVTGIALGVSAAVLLTPVMSALLYGVSPTDPATYAGVALALGAATLVATYLPARRASRVPPIVALRSGTS